MHSLRLAACVAAALGGTSASAQEMDHGAMGHGHEMPAAAPETPATTDHGAMGHAAAGTGHGDAGGPAAHDSPSMTMDHGTMHDGRSGARAATPAHEGMAQTAGADDGAPAMQHDMGSMQGGSPPPDARDPHAYSGGYGFGPIERPRLADEHNFGGLLFDRLEAVESDEGGSAAYEFQAWYGRDYDRLVVEAEGEVDDGELHESHTELLWSHAIGAYWDSQIGVRHDSGEGPDRTWLAFGVEGLAPYWFEVDATAYLGEEGRTALGVEVEYELLLTQRLILQPGAEATFYGKDDEARGLGSGLAEASAGLRLRYEVRRQFAPYVGVEWAGLFGDTADLAEAAGEDTGETRWVAGVRMWF